MTDTFRKEYKELTQLQKDDMFIIKEKAQILLEYLIAIEMNSSIDFRCMALARTNLEQAVMWAIKAIT
jgi:hypothetical protein